MNLFKKSSSFLAFFLLLFSCKKETDTVTPVSESLVSKHASAESFATVTSLITNVNSNTSTNYQSATLADNITIYVDRTYKITAYPSALSGGQIIKTAGNDKSVTSTQLTFNLTKAATVYIAYDQRATKIPAWLDGWTDLSETITTTDPSSTKMDLYSKTFNSGTVSLGGNMASPAAGAVATYVVFAKASSGTTTPPTSSTFMLGINGHSLSQTSYKSISASGQMAMLTKMGMTGFRVDINFDDDGSIRNSLFAPLYSAANAAKVTILPMIYPETLNYNKSESSNYAAGKTLGHNVALKNSKYFSYYELGNELDNRVLNSGNGDQSSQYNQKKFKVVAAYLKGMDDGIKSVQPGAKTMVDASWLHYAFLQMVIKYGCKFDIIAYHWYSEMETLTGKGTYGFTDITKKLSSLFPTKPIWFTEVGNRYKKVSNIDQLQEQFMDGFISKCKKNSQVKVLMFYELLNEPEKSAVPLEANYGVTKWVTKYTKWAWKPAGTSMFAK